MNITEYLESKNLYIGRMVGLSKSFYIFGNPGNEVYFNANIFDSGGNKIWYGDLDITKDGSILQQAADQFGDLYILKEMDGRFENENKGVEWVKDKSVRIYCRK